MDVQAWLKSQYGLSRKKTMPVLSFPSIQFMGITVRDLVGSSDLQAKGMKLIADRVDSSASVSMMDLSVEAEAFGSVIRYSDDEVPTVVGGIVATEEEANALAVPVVGAGRTGRYVEAIGKAVRLITDRPVFAGVIGPFSLAGRLLDVSEALISCYDEPEMVHAVLRKATAFLIDYIRAYKAAGAHGAVMAEPLTGLLSPALAAEFSEPYVKAIVDAVRDDEFLVIYHNCGGSAVAIIDSILKVGASAYHFGNAVSMADVLAKVPESVLVMGNVDPAAQFCKGTPASIRAETLRIMGECCGHENFVISSGCDIPPASPWANIDAYFKAVEEFYDGRG